MCGPPQCYRMHRASGISPLTFAFQHRLQPSRRSGSHLPSHHFLDPLFFLNKTGSCMEADTRLPPNNASKSAAQLREDEYVSKDACTICLERISERAIAAPCNH